MYLNHHDLSKYWAIDIETDLIPSTKIWVVRVENVATGEVARFVDRDSFHTFVRANPDCVWVGHYALSFDIPTLNRLWGAGIPLDRVCDTLVLSYLYHPTMPGGHSLEAWGERFGFPKDLFDDFSRYSPELEERCRIDVSLTVRLFKALTKRMRDRGFSERSAKLEHDIRAVIDRQQINGFYFDIPRATELLAYLRQRERELGGGIRELFKPELVLQDTYKYRTKKDGSPYSSYHRHLEQYDRVDLRGDEYDVYAYEEFNIGSPKQRVERLLRLGYQPTKFTPTGAPKVDEESLVEFAELCGEPAVKAIADWLVHNGRGNMVNTWLNNVDHDDSRMHGRVFTCGAGTRRMTHNSPNTANIPGLEVLYGPEVRDLWMASPGKVLVGVDAKACQMRMFGHYLNNDKTAKRYYDTETYGDPHQNNAEAFGDGSKRKKAKNVFFSFIFGAQPPKLASTWGVPKGEGKKLRQILYDNNPGLEALTRAVQEEFKANGGWLTCIDGGLVRCHSDHAALNYKIQSAEKCQMATALVILDKRLEERGIWAGYCANVHDEWQTEVNDEKDGKEFGEMATQAMRDAGEELGFRVPMDGDYRIGRTWKDTH